jgi:excisionase family DNA binding protein
MVSKPQTIETLAPDMMSLREFSELTGISLTTVYELAAAGELPVPAPKIGRQYRISRIAYARWLDSGVVTPDAD